MTERRAREGAASSDREVAEDAVWEALERVIDPELGMDIVTLGLVYGVSLDPERTGRVRITHTLTTPGCPLEAHIRSGIRRAAERVPGVRRAESELVWEPRWHPRMIQEDVS